VTAPTVRIETLSEHEGTEVLLEGWLSGKRSGGKVVFLQVRDGSGVCQCVVEASRPTPFAAAQEVSLESSLRLSGLVRKDNRAEGGFEILIDRIEVIHTAAEYPISRKAHGIDFLMSKRHLWLRSRRTSAILRIRHTLIKTCRDFFDERGFVLIDTPIMTAGAGEDTQSLFPVDYFGRRAFLTQTGQLHVESACMAFGRVYCFGPTFRAEKSKTRRHLAEFWMIEPEIAFAGLDDVIELAEELVRCLVEGVLSRHSDDLRLLDRNIAALRKAVDKPFARITYSEAVERLRSSETRERFEARLDGERRLLQSMIDELAELEKQLPAIRKARQQEKLRNRIQELRDRIRELDRDLADRPAHLASAQSFEWGGDLGGSDETILCEQFETPVFVTDYPARVKAFYMKRHPEDSRLVRNVDLLAPEGYGEIVGGIQREDDLDVLTSAMLAKGLDPADYEWYLDLRRYGSVPHGGFGLGIERTLSWICGLKHVRETIPFPRTISRLEP